MRGSSIHWFIAVALWSSESAFACSPALPSEQIKDVQLRQLALAEVKASDAIIDGQISGYALTKGMSQPDVLLKVLKTWKGPNLRVYRVWDGGCGTQFPRKGQKVRVLLNRVGDNLQIWDARDPALGGRVWDHRRMDRAIDTVIRAPRPKDFNSIAGDMPPEF